MNPRRTARPARIYAIADADALAPRTLVAGACEMAAAGIELIQLRAKHLADRLLHREVEACLRALEGWQGALWIDDRVDLAALFPLSGVHLGQSDLPVGPARTLLPADRMVGLSTHDEAQFAAGVEDAGVDWIALGPIFPTASKQDPDPVVGVERMSALRARTAMPMIAIGGIDAANVAAVLAGGADSAAVLAAVCRGDIADNCRRLLRAAGA